MVIPLFAVMEVLFQILLALVAIFLILLVLVQRGRGGGLAGALGGMGGSSAFGAKAGDVFTRITVIAAAVWIVLCIVAAKLGPTSAGSRLDVGDEVSATRTVEQPIGEAASAADKNGAEETTGEAAAATEPEDSTTEESAGEPASAGGSPAGGESESKPE